MKNTSILIFLITNLGFHSQVFSQSLQERVIGKWQLVQTSGGITGRGFPIKKKIVIEFTPECRFNRYENDSLKSTRTYHLTKSKARYSGQGYKDILDLGNGGSFNNSIRINKNQLILAHEVADGFIKIYNKTSAKKEIEAE